MAVYVRRFIACGLLAMGGTWVSTQAAAGTCSAAYYLKGTYGLLVSGNSLAANAAGGKYLTGALNFNSTSCTITGSNISGGNNGAAATQSVTGTYGLNTDGTMTIFLSPADKSPTQEYIVGVSQSNWEAVGIETDGSAAATIDLTPQVWNRQPSPIYTNASLTGRFSVSCNGLASYKDDLNYVKFDGKGNILGQNPYDYDGSIGDLPYTGSYSVAADGTLSGVLFNTYSQYSFRGVIDDQGIDVKYIYNRAGFGNIVACHGRK
jgi:hypothetical protein